MEPHTCIMFEESEEEKRMTKEVFNQYQSIFQLLPFDQILNSTNDRLNGLLQCIAKGPNPEEVPDYKRHYKASYYAWASWKHASLQIKRKYKDDKSTPFEYQAMWEYIRRVDRYLRKLKLIPFCGIP